MKGRKRYCPKGLRPPLERMRALAEGLRADAKAWERDPDPVRRADAFRMEGMAQGCELCADMYLDWADDMRLAVKEDG